LTEASGVIYEGQWSDNLRDGFGTETLTTSEKYQVKLKDLKIRYKKNHKKLN